MPSIKLIIASSVSQQLDNIIFYNAGEHSNSDINNLFQPVGVIVKLLDISIVYILTIINSGYKFNESL